jgi:hypothetical protein
VPYHPRSHVGRIISGILRKPSASPSIPYLSISRVASTFAVPKDFDLADFEGLEMCCILSPTTSSKELVSMWCDEAHYHLHHASLRHKLALELPTTSGFLSGVVQHKEGLWKRYRWYDWLIGLVALFGALTALHAYFANMFDAPQVNVAFADTAAVDVDEDTGFNVQISLLNEDAYSATKVESVKAFGKCADRADISLTPNASNLPMIGSAQSASIRLDGMSVHHGSVGPPIDCNLVVSVSARTGFLRSEGSFSASKMLRVWTTGIGWGNLKLPDPSNGVVERSRSLPARVTIYPGRAYDQGAQGSLQVRSILDENVVISLGRQFDKVNPLSSLPSRDNEVINAVDFQTRPLDKFRPYVLSFGLTSKSALSADRWREILARSEFHVQ